MKKPGLLWICLLLLLKNGFAQTCGGSISSFPYEENFETSNGNWIAGGTASDWTWGIPTKTVITAAAGGNRCWITGGLNNPAYNAGENSWLMSPCFDFSTLQFPEINFQFFCETERRFDGASFQYSIDGGNNWLLLGGANTSTNNCAITNWYNTESVTYLGNTAGWTGTIRPDNGSCMGGNGAGRWVSARHPLRMLAGQPNVRFRFRFGAGTQCNSFDGFAVDNILIWEATPPVTEITAACTTPEGSMFFGAVSLCIVKFEWNFGDPASGVNNTSTLPGPTHVFTNLGQEYTVTLVAEYGTGIKVTSTKKVRLLNATKTITWPGACNNIPDATITVNPTGSPDNSYFYYWNTSPPQMTQTITNRGPGNYRVIITAADACGITLDFDLPFPSVVKTEADIRPAACNNNNGAISLTNTGGFPPYTFLWSNSATTKDVSNLAPGDYTVQITDANNCRFNAGPFTIRNDESAVKANLGPDRFICPGQTISLSPGNFARYLWQDGSTNPAFTISGAGTFSVEVTDAQGCMSKDTIQVSADCRDIWFPSAFTPDNDGTNDFFGPLGNILSMEKYSLRIFNRYGQLVFSTFNPLQKWNGSFTGSLPQAGSYVWMASYVFNGRETLKKGSILLIR